MKIVPIITCKPWNPVAIKNVDPYTASAIVKGASTYSKAWKPVKMAAKITVIKIPTITARRLPPINA
jgi:hypothetical protein